MKLSSWSAYPESEWQYSVCSDDKMQPSQSMACGLCPLSLLRALSTLCLFSFPCFVPFSLALPLNMVAFQFLSLHGAASFKNQSVCLSYHLSIYHSSISSIYIIHLYLSIIYHLSLYLIYLSSIYLFIYLSIYLIYLYGTLVCMFVCCIHLHVWSHSDQERTSHPLELVRDCCEPPCGFWELNLGSMQK